MSTLFDAVYIMALTLGSPYFFLKFIATKRYRSGLSQRLGRINTKKRTRPCVWIHCASVGEVLTVKALVKSLGKEFNCLDIVVSTNTNTGLSVAQRFFDSRNVFYFPLDLSWIADKVLGSIQPICIILIELELWPNFLIAAARRHIPVVLLNARISEKSLKWYRVISKISQGFCESLTRKENVFCARTGADAIRLVNFGIPEAQIFITGNMKFDNIVTDVPEDVKKRLTDLFEMNKNDTVIVCGSTHEGEEAIILKTFRQIKGKIRQVRLVLAPRHVERIHDLVKLIESMGLGWIKKTSLDQGKKIGERKYETIILIDTVGELLTAYSIADCVFVGKSLVPHGGQNMLEPAGLAKPIIVGPHTFNFHEEVQLLQKADAIEIIQDESTLLNKMTYLLEHPDEAREMGRRAQSVVMKQRGATDRNVKVLRKILLKERTVSV